MLQVPGHLNLQAIEDSLLSLQRLPDQKTIWPFHVRGIALGGEAALAQLIITWALAARRPALNLPTGSFTPQQIDEFVSQLHGLTASLVCESAVDQSGEQHQELLRANALLKLHELDGSTPRNALHRLHDLTILCADHLGRNTPRLLYYSGVDRAPSVRNEKEFRLLVHWILRSITPESRQRRNSSIGDAVGSMLHEVFENTEEHATKDLEGNLLRKSLRGFFARHHWLSEHESDTLTEGYPALRQFCRAIPSSGTRKQLLEISVFDSGPGFAQRLTKTKLSELSTKQEFGAVRDCFRGRVTTKTHSGHGIGLKYVLRLLRQRQGFLRLRTGRLSLFADLSKDGLTEADSAPDLRDASGGEVARRAVVQGTLMSLLIPLS
jgi:hypothetical protein